MWHILNVANAESVLLITMVFFVYIFLSQGLPWWLSSKECACQCRRHRRCAFDPWLRKIPWRRKWQPTPVFLPRKTHGQRSLVGYSPWGCTEPTHIYKCICCAVLTQLCPTLRDPVDCSPPGSFVHGDSPGKNTGVSCHAPGDLLNPGIKSRSPTLQTDSLPSEPSDQIRSDQSLSHVRLFATL